MHAHPHIGLIDPVTGQLIKSWTGFKDAERLMDKLTEMADTPPTDGFAAMDAEPPPVGPCFRACARRLEGLSRDQPGSCCPAYPLPPPTAAPVCPTTA